MPHGTIPPKCARSGATLIAKPWSVTQRFTRTPSAPIFFSSGALADPDADASLGAMGGDAELGERGNHPAFERMDEAADVLPALFEVEHHVADPLARAVIGVAAAAAGFVDRKAERIAELGGVGAGAGGEQGRVLEQPDALARAYRRGSPRRAPP